MKTRNAQSRSKGGNTEANQVLTRAAADDTRHRPASGVLRPAHGTMEAPVVVVGATGTIGRALVRRLVAAGQPVVAIAPQADRLERLRRAVVPAAIGSIVGRIETDADAQRLAAQLRALARPLAAVVVTLPHGRVGVGCGRLLEQPTGVLVDDLAQSVRTQHALARHLIPLLGESGRNTRYVVVGGPGSETPWAGYGLRSVAAAATRMLARVLHDEARALGVRVQLVSIDAPLRGEQPRAHECPEWPTASGVADRVARLIDRTSADDETTDAVVTCVRSRTGFAPGRPGRTFDDLPSFLASLRNPTNKITPH